MNKIPLINSITCILYPAALISDSFFYLIGNIDSSQNRQWKHFICPSICSSTGHQCVPGKNKVKCSRPLPDFRNSITNRELLNRKLLFSSVPGFLQLSLTFTLFSSSNTSPPVRFQSETSSWCEIHISVGILFIMLTVWAYQWQRQRHSLWSGQLTCGITL